MTSLRLAIVGAGNIGLRHAQSVAGLAGKIDVDIVDPVAASRQKVTAAFQGSNKSAAGYSSILQLPQPPDVAIVATDSKSRREAIEQLLARGCRTFILEKVLFTRLADYDAIENALRDSGARAWVNCPRRSYPGAEQLASALDGKAISYCVSGSNWDLGCNLIHFLDEFCWIIRENDVALNIDGLRTGVVAAKRPGYVEFSGAVIGVVGPHRFEAISRENLSDKTLVTIKAGGDEFIIGGGSIVKNDRGGLSTTEPYPVLLQSELTAKHLEMIVAGRSPPLPTYKDSAVLHRALIQGFLSHLRKSAGNPAIDECPIT